MNRYIPKTVQFQTKITKFNKFLKQFAWKMKFLKNSMGNFFTDCNIEEKPFNSSIFNRRVFALKGNIVD